MNQRNQEKELLRFSTAGSVDDGKSTLIGRLLHDTGGVYEDQVEAVRRVAQGSLDFAFLTDGLQAEREQGITIDVAYRYFATGRRSFIIADTPGHEQYTRNMATGASTSDLALVLVDARKGVLRQTRRHLCIAWLLGIPRILVVVNKMDLAGYRQETYESIRLQLDPLAGKLEGCAVDFLPVSALEGENVAASGPRMPWFTGPSLLEYLETVPIERAGEEDAPLRLPVQYVVRAPDVRGYAGRIASGTVKAGDELLVLPSGQPARIAALLERPPAAADRASVPMSVCITLDRQLDAGRGDMFVSPANPPTVGRTLRATVVWMSETPLQPGRPYLVKHTTQQVCAEATGIVSILDIATLEERPASEGRLNEIVDVVIETHRPIFWDPYCSNRRTGSFILIDPATNQTAGAGLIRGAAASQGNGSARNGNGHAGAVVWFTGLSSAGKTTLSRAAYERLWAAGVRVEMLDGDEVRRHLSKGLGFGKEDRDENIRRIGFVAELLARNGVTVLVSAISPYRAVRQELRSRLPNFIEIYVNAPLEVCEARDVKGLYRKARAGELRAFTGVTDPYEPPLHPEVECRTDRETLAESVAKVLEAIRAIEGGG
jgi:bifunctional enzyme CysN/CysC